MLQEIHQRTPNFHFHKSTVLSALMSFVKANNIGSKRYRRMLIRENLEALQRMCDNLRWSVLKCYPPALELLGLPADHNPPPSTLTDADSETTTPTKTALISRRRKILLHRGKLVKHMHKKSKHQKTARHTAFDFLDRFSDFELSQPTRCEDLDIEPFQCTGFPDLEFNGAIEYMEVLDVENTDYHNDMEILERRLDAVDAAEFDRESGTAWMEFDGNKFETTVLSKGEGDSTMATFTLRNKFLLDIEVRGVTWTSLQAARNCC